MKLYRKMLLVAGKLLCMIEFQVIVHLMMDNDRQLKKRKTVFEPLDRISCDVHADDTRTQHSVKKNENRME